MTEPAAESTGGQLPLGRSARPQGPAGQEPLLSDKHELRLWMRRLRRELTDRAARSERIWERVIGLTEVHAAHRVLAYTTVTGEPEVAPLIAWCEADGKVVGVPEDNFDPSWPDVVIVPGVAFTRDGHRLGQGGGWYDRFLPHLRSQSVTIGVCFDPQLVDVLPVEPHDVVLDVVVTESAVHRP